MNKEELIKNIEGQGEFKYLDSQEKQKEVLGYSLKKEYEVFLHTSDNVLIMVNTLNGKIAVEWASEELPAEHLKRIIELAEFYANKGGL